MLSVRENVINTCKTQNYDGLCNLWLGCFCSVNDLAPCGNIELDCGFGVKHTHTKDASLYIIGDRDIKYPDEVIEENC